MDGDAASSEVTERELSLMPWPASVERGRGRFRVDERFDVAVLGEPGDRVHGAAERLLERIRRRTTLFLRQGRVSSTGASPDADLTIRVGRSGELEVGEDESYRLEVDPAGVLLRAPTDLGALHGLQTLLQLLEVDEDGVRVPAVTVEDHPRFPWRGLMIDVARHFMPAEVLRRNLDAMARLKLNVLHLHLTDDQGFRVESRRWPRLHREASDGRYYTREQIGRLVGYAADRGIRVVPEFDVPGHATSWLVAYPELAAGPAPRGLARGFGVLDPVLDPTREEVYDFLASFLEEMGTLFPDRYVHLGGDEVEGTRWREDPEIRAYMEDRGLQDAAALQVHFLERLAGILSEQGKEPVVWGGPGAGLSREAVLQVWRRRESLEEALRAGGRALLSRGYYLDLNRSAAAHHAVDPLPSRWNLPRRARKRMLGGEAAMWSEGVDAGTVDSRIWPRAAAVAERLWSQASVTDTEDMYRRLSSVSHRLDGMGLEHVGGPRRLLRSLTGTGEGDALEALELLAGLAAPVEGLRWRRSDRRYTVRSPLSRFVDAAPPDPARARRFRRAVERTLEAGPGSAAFDSVRDELASWSAAVPVLRRLAGERRPLREIAPLVDGLEGLARRGLEALGHLAEEGPPPAGWASEAAPDLRRARSSVAETRLLVTEPVARLVDRAAEGAAGGPDGRGVGGGSGRSDPPPGGSPDRPRGSDPG